MLSKIRKKSKVVKIVISNEEMDKKMALRSAVAFFLVIIMLIWSIGFKDMLMSSGEIDSISFNFTETKAEISEIFRNARLESKK